MSCCDLYLMLHALMKLDFVTSSHYFFTHAIIRILKIKYLLYILIINIMHINYKCTFYTYKIVILKIIYNKDIKHFEKRELKKFARE